MFSFHSSHIFSPKAENENRKNRHRDPRKPVDIAKRVGRPVYVKHAAHDAAGGERRDPGVVEIAAKSVRVSRAPGEAEHEVGQRAQKKRKCERVDHEVGVDLVAEELVDCSEEAGEDRDAEEDGGDLQRGSFIFFSNRCIQCRSRSFP